jgi:hypothetical protein
MEDFVENDGKRVAELKCSHIFHESCLQEWIEKQDTCPMCRELIKSDEPAPFEGN